MDVIVGEESVSVTVSVTSGLIVTELLSKIETEATLTSTFSSASANIPTEDVSVGSSLGIQLSGSFQ